MAPALAGVEHDPAQVALLVLVFMEAAHEGLGNPGLASEAVGDLLADVAGPELLDILVLGQAGALQELDEADAVEVAGGVLEVSIVGDLARTSVSLEMPRPMLRASSVKVASAMRRPSTCCGSPNIWA